MSKQKQICIVGTGYWGVNLVRTFHSLGVLAGVCDNDADRAARMAQEYDTRAFAFEELLRDASISAVAVATPAETHFALVESLLQSGKDVFVEKPITLDLGECGRLIELADKNSRILMVDHLLEYHPAINMLSGMVRQGELGEIRYIHCRRLNMGKIRNTENALWSLAPHDVSLILMLLGGELPEEVAAGGGAFLQDGIEDVVMGSMNFSGGRRGFLHVSWLHPQKEQQMVVMGTKAMAIFDDTQQNDKLRISPCQINRVDGVYSVQPPSAITVPIPATRPLDNACAHFLDCTLTRRQPLSDGQDGRRVLTVLSALQRSLETKQPLRLFTPATMSAHAH